MVTDQKKLREININSPPHEKNSSQQMYIYVDWLEAVNIFGRAARCLPYILCIFFSLRPKSYACKEYVFDLDDHSLECV